MNSWKVILATLVIFGTGVVTGGLLVNHAVGGRPAPVPPPPAIQAATPWAARMRDLMRRMDMQLALQPEQRARIEKIMVDSQERTRVLWQPILPQMNQEMQNVHMQIRGELNPNQRRKFEMIFRPRPPRKPDDLPNQTTRARPGATPQVEGTPTNPSPSDKRP